MRQSIAYYFLILYALVLFKPVIAVVSDDFSHFFAEAIHIATVHAKYGSNHLQKEVSDLACSNSKGHNVSIPEDNLSPHINTKEVTFFYTPGLKVNFPFQRQFGLEFILISKQGPPPKY